MLLQRIWNWKCWTLGKIKKRMYSKRVGVNWADCQLRGWLENVALVGGGEYVGWMCHRAESAPLASRSGAGLSAQSWMLYLDSKASPRHLRPPYKEKCQLISARLVMTYLQKSRCKWLKMEPLFENWLLFPYHVGIIRLSLNLRYIKWKNTENTVVQADCLIKIIVQRTRGNKVKWYLSAKMKLRKLYFFVLFICNKAVLLSGKGNHLPEKIPLLKIQAL